MGGVQNQLLEGSQFSEPPTLNVVIHTQDPESVRTGEIVGVQLVEVKAPEGTSVDN